MRDKKFRVYDKSENDFIYFTALNGLYSEVDETYRKRCLDQVEQYTGLKDKNGKDIYEGDIVKIIALGNDHSQLGATEIMNVFYFMGNACLRWEERETGVTMYPLNVDHSIEIIGNIHQVIGE